MYLCSLEPVCVLPVSGFTIRTFSRPLSPDFPEHITATYCVRVQHQICCYATNVVLWPRQPRCYLALKI